MKIICIGDSLTTGFGVFKENRWTEILVRDYKLDIVNKGLNGDTTSGMLCRFYEDVIALKPSHVNIMGGCNDLLSNRRLTNIIGNVEEMVKDSVSAGIKPVLCTEAPVIEDLAKRKWSWDSDYKYVIESTLEYRNWILSYCYTNNLPCIDFHKLFMDELTCRKASELYIDGLHPSEYGHRIMAEEASKIFSNFS